MTVFWCSFGGSAVLIFAAAFCLSYFCDRSKLLHKFLWLLLFLLLAGIAVVVLRVDLAARRSQYRLYMSIILYALLFALCTGYELGKFLRKRKEK